MQYKKVTIKLSPMNETASEIMVAQMGELGFDSFEDTDDGFIGYAQMVNFVEGSLASLNPLVEGVSFEMSEEVVDDEDWNKEWEENYFKPIVIDGRCRIRSPFQEADPSMEYEIVIDPKMSFGTGYHETTTMMMQYLMELDLQGLRILDMGCGTGILGIMARKRLSGVVDCVDIDEWSTRNTSENLVLNAVDGINVILGGAEVLPQVPTFDMVVANINRNILVHDMARYAASLKSGGTMLLSGFYTADAQIVVAEAERFGLSLVQRKEINDWNGLRLVKA